MNEWHPASNAPFDQDLELSVIEKDEVHALVFSCRRTTMGWITTSTKSPVSVDPSHWRPWSEKRDR
jgi:hypothetical protein